MQPLDITYDCTKMDLEEKTRFILDCKAICYKQDIDYLDCSESFFRQSDNDMTFEEVMKKFDNKCHFTVIYRQNRFAEHGPYFEVSFSEIKTGKSYFLWLFVEPEKFYKLMEKYSTLT